MKKEDDHQETLVPITIDELQRQLEACESRRADDEKRIKELVADCIKYSDIILKIDNERMQLQELLKKERSKIDDLIDKLEGDRGQ